MTSLNVDQDGSNPRNPSTQLLGLFHDFPLGEVDLHKMTHIRLKS